MGDICYAVQEHAEEAGYSVVRELTGHGIGTQLHEEPQVAELRGPGRGHKLSRGQVWAVEPMVNLAGEEVK